MTIFTVLPFFGLTVSVTEQLPRFTPLTLPAETLQNFFWAFEIFNLTLAPVGMVLPAAKAKHLAVAYFAALTEQGFGLQSLRESDPIALNVLAGHRVWAVAAERAT